MVLSRCRCYPFYPTSAGAAARLDQNCPFLEDQRPTKQKNINPWACRAYCQLKRRERPSVRYPTDAMSIFFHPWTWHFGGYVEVAIHAEHLDATLLGPRVVEPIRGRFKRLRLPLAVKSTRWGSKSLNRNGALELRVDGSGDNLMSIDARKVWHIDTSKPANIFEGLACRGSINGLV